MAGAAVEGPDGTVRDVIYPAVGEQTLKDLVKDLVREAKATGPTYRTTLRATIRSSYRGHYRRAVLDLIAALDFRSNNDAHQPVIQALDLVRRYAGTRVRSYPAEENVPLDGVVRPLWRDLHVRRRYLTAEQLRKAIAVVTNATLRVRDPLIWGEGTNACASDSKHFGV